MMRNPPEGCVAGVIENDAMERMRDNGQPRWQGRWIGMDGPRKLCASAWTPVASAFLANQAKAASARFQG